MRAPKYVVFGVAAVAAILLAVLAKGLLSGKPTNKAEASAKIKAPEVAMVKVLVAARPIKAGERLTEADMIWLDWPASAKSEAYHIKGEGPAPIPVTPIVDAKKPADAKTDQAKLAKKATEIADTVLNPAGGMENFIGGVVREDFQAHEPIIDAKIVRANEGGFMAVMLEPGMRAMAVPVSVENTAGGFILPGDRVDVNLSHEVPRPGGSGNMFVARTILSNIKILAIDQTAAVEKGEQNLVGATATLSVTPQQGQALAQAKAMGSLSLMLRSYADVNAPSGLVEAPAANPSQNSVKVFRDGSSTEVMVSR